MHSLKKDNRETAKEINEEMPFFDDNLVTNIQMRRRTTSEIWDLVDNKETLSEEVIQQFEEDHRLMLVAIKQRNEALHD